MKKIVLFLTLIGIGTTALAQDTIKDRVAYCESLTDLAIVAQVMRQKNHSSSDTLKQLEPVALSFGTQELIAFQKNVNLKIVESAFAIPVAQTREEKEYAVVNFSAGFRDGCMSNIPK